MAEPKEKLLEPSSLGCLRLANSLAVGDVDGAADSDGCLVLTYATHRQGYMDVLEQSCARYGYRLRILGMGERWRGYCAKLNAAIAAMRSLPRNQLVLFVDAFDVFMCAPASLAESVYREAGEPTMLVGASRSVGGDAFALVHNRMFDESSNLRDNECKKSPYRFTCAGTYLCRAGPCADLLQAAGVVDDSQDDQAVINRLRKQHGSSAIALDYSQRAFATLLSSFVRGKIRSEDRITVRVDADGNKRVHCGVTDTMPLLVHGPGDTDLSPLIAQLGFDVPPRREATPHSYVLSKVTYHTKQMFDAFRQETLLGFAVLMVFLAILLIVVAILRDRRKSVQLQQQQNSLSAKSVHNSQNTTFASLAPYAANTLPTL
jgi:hypothetical protein